MIANLLVVDESIFVVSHCRHVVVDVVGTDFQRSDVTAMVESFQKQERHGDGSDFKFKQGSVITKGLDKTFEKLDYSM